MVKCKAAVAFAPKQPLEMIDIEVADPKKGEVMIKIFASSLCHTDLYTLSGIDPQGLFPCILGHEGAGVVVKVGEGVTLCQEGDHVVPLYTAECGQCKYCKRCNLCQAIRPTQDKGVMPDGTTRFTNLKDGSPIYHYMGCSTFSEYTVLPEIALAKIEDKSLPMKRICLFGCGISTGVGAAMNTAKVEPGSTVAVFGLGAIGLAVVLGCKQICKASKIIAIDRNKDKFPLARKLGATDCIEPSDDIISIITEKLTDGGVDYSFECIGNVNVMRTALECCHKGWGVSTIVGVAGAGELISTVPRMLVTGRTWKGTAFGGVKGRSQINEMIQRVGLENADLFVTREMPFIQINKAIEEARGALRIVFTYDVNK